MKRVVKDAMSVTYGRYEARRLGQLHGEPHESYVGYVLNPCSHGLSLWARRRHVMDGFDPKGTSENSRCSGAVPEVEGCTGLQRRDLSTHRIPEGTGVLRASGGGRLKGTGNNKNTPMIERFRRKDHVYNGKLKTQRKKKVRRSATRAI